MNLSKLEVWRELHKSMLDNAVDAARTRQSFSPFSDELSDYDPALIWQGEEKFNAMLGTAFNIKPDEIEVDGVRWAGAERSPYGFDLGISYSCEAFAELVSRADSAMCEWQEVDVELRCALLCEVITRLHNDTFLFAHVGMHSSGHGLLMGFHANAIHAQARALESVANVLSVSRELTRQLDTTMVVGQGERQHLTRYFRAMPAGLSLVYSGQVVPTWGAYPGLFASLAAGCPVILIPHSNAVLPIALTIKAIKEVCAEVGLPHDIINLFYNDDWAYYQQAAQHHSVRLIDYMGGNQFGCWLRQHAWQAQVMTQQSAQTSVFLHSTVDYDGMLENLAFGLCSYSAQLCTSPQTLYVLSEGIRIVGGVVSVEQFQQDLVARIDQVLRRFSPERELLGALVFPKSLVEIRDCESAEFTKVLRYAKVIQDSDYPNANIVTPSVIAVQQGYTSSPKHYGREIRGPISFVIQKQDLQEVLVELRDIGLHHGVLGLGLYSTDVDVENAVSRLAEQIGALLSINFCKNYYISQCSVFTDIHGGATGAAANVTYGAPAFYHTRLRVTEKRKLR